MVDVYSDADFANGVSLKSVSGMVFKDVWELCVLAF